jgi:hypothetical protein
LEGEGFFERVKGGVKQVMDHADGALGEGARAVRASVSEGASDRVESDG